MDTPTQVPRKCRMTQVSLDGIMTTHGAPQGSEGAACFGGGLLNSARPRVVSLGLADLNLFFRKYRF